MQKVILRSSVFMFTIFLILSFLINWGVRYRIEVSRFLTQADSLFWQIDQIIENNDQNIADIKEEFSAQCLISATAAAYISSYNPSLHEDIDELKKVADLLGVDEIHFFTSEGVIYAGTHPEYYNYSFSSGEQMQFFQPLLEDKSLMLCQDITPNTAEEKPMQYAAVWNESGTEIVQIGVTPSRVLEAQAGTTISDVFAMMPISDGQIFFALDPTTYEIVGSTAPDLEGLSVTDFGVSPYAELPEGIGNGTALGEHTLDGSTYFYLIHLTDSLIIVNLYATENITKTVVMDSIITAIYIILFGIVATIFVLIYLNRKIVRSIVTINSKLAQIEQGNLAVTFTQATVPEVKSLSDHINSMVKSLINQTHKLSLALDLAQIPTGIVEYNTATKKITATNKVREILQLSPEAYMHAFSHADFLTATLQDIITNNTLVEQNVLRFNGTDTYIKMEQFQDGDNVLLLVMDISHEVQEKELIKHQRDTDILTGLYNRRAFLRKVEQILPERQSPYFAVCMIDVDSLKPVNDSYGHEIGDTYLRNIAKLIHFEGDFLAGRLGGDEFAALLYHASDCDVLIKRLTALQDVQDTQVMDLGHGAQIPLAFSFGYAISPTDGTDYTSLMKVADTRMYANKCQRKGGPRNHCDLPL